MGSEGLTCEPGGKGRGKTLLVIEHCERGGPGESLAKGSVQVTLLSVGFWQLKTGHLLIVMVLKVTGLWEFDF